MTSAQVIRDRDTGISRGFAFVTFMCETSVEGLLRDRYIYNVGYQKRHLAIHRVYDEHLASHLNT